MNRGRYIGLDVHQATISVAVMDSKGKVESILESKAATILEFFAGLRGTLAVTFEEGTWAAWLHDLLKPHVAKLVRSTGGRGSSRDAASRVEDDHATGWHHFSRQDYPQATLCRASRDEASGSLPQRAHARLQESLFIFMVAGPAPSGLHLCALNCCWITACARACCPAG